MSCLVYRGRQWDKLELRCDDGQYKIRWRKKIRPVEYAYHEEVETGSNPLVFVTKGLTLTTVSYRFYSQAEVVIDEKTFKGLCFLD